MMGAPLVIPIKLEEVKPYDIDQSDDFSLNDR
jgi:hypothetical protein